MIRVQDLGRRFGTMWAIRGLAFELQAGEVFGLLGPNGAGKTTTVRVLTALIAPSEGRASVNGFDVVDAPEEVRRRIGLLTESPGLYERLTAVQNLDFFGRLQGVTAGVRAERIERLLRLFDLWGRRNDQAGTFSKGMKQKLAIARALLHEPEVLFLDEPTSALDPEAARLVREFLTTLKQEGRTIFLCTHNLDEADRLCDRIAIFNTRLLALDTPTALRRKLYGRTVVFHLAGSDGRFAETLEPFDFVHSVQTMDNKLVVTLEAPETQNPILVRALVQAGAEVQFVGEVRRTLEDVYLQLVERGEAGSDSGKTSR